MNEFQIYSQKNWKIIRTAFKVKCTDIFKIFIQILMNIIVKLVLIKIIYFIVIIPYLQLQLYYFSTCIIFSFINHVYLNALLFQI